MIDLDKAHYRRWSPHTAALLSTPYVHLTALVTLYRGNSSTGSSSTGSSSTDSSSPGSSSTDSSSTGSSSTGSSNTALRQLCLSAPVKRWGKFCGTITASWSSSLASSSPATSSHFTLGFSATTAAAPPTVNTAAHCGSVRSAYIQGSPSASFSLHRPRLSQHCSKRTHWSPCRVFDSASVVTVYWRLLLLRVGWRHCCR